jgi:undecaprenyl pyrophosphate synthase
MSKVQYTESEKPLLIAMRDLQLYNLKNLQVKVLEVFANQEATWASQKEVARIMNMFIKTVENSYGNLDG